MTAAALVEVTVVAGLVFFGNSEYFERGYQSIVISEPRTDDPFIVRLIIHKIASDENAVEASVVIEAPGAVIERLPSKTGDCLVVSIDDRSHERLIQAKEFSFDCQVEPGYGFVARQTSRFLLPAWQSVAMYPFDDLKTWPLVRLTVAGGEPPTRYVVAKTMSGRILSQRGTELNWEIHLGRSTNQQIAILLAATMFIALALFAAWKILTASSPASGIEGVLAVAGFVLAATGFRSLLGVERLAGTSTFEIAVFLFPLILLVASILIAQARNTVSLNRS